jgi:phage-related minor tail protein
MSNLQPKYIAFGVRYQFNQRGYKALAVIQAIEHFIIAGAFVVGSWAAIWLAYFAFTRF